MLKSRQVTQTFMPRSGPSDLALYFQHRLREAVKADREAQDIAREADLSPGQISGLMNHAKGFGFRTFEGMLRVFRLTEAEAREQATAFVLRHPEVLQGRRAAMESVVVREPRYKALDAAIGFFLAEGGSQEAADIVRSMSLKSDGDLTPGEWLAELKVEDRKLRARARDPVGAAREELEREEQAAQQQREDDAAKARGDTAQPGYRERLAEAQKRRKK